MQRQLINIIMGIILMISLIGLANAGATCVPTMSEASIVCQNNCSFPSGQKFSNMSIYMSSNLGDLTGKTVSIAILDSNKNPINSLGAKVTTQIQSNRTITVGCNTGSTCLSYVPNTGTYYLKVVIDPTNAADPGKTYLNYIFYQQLKVQPGITLKLNCPDNAQIDTPIICTWIATDPDTMQALTVTPNIIITQGDQVIQPTSIELGKATFTTSNLLDKIVFDMTASAAGHYSAHVIANPISINAPVVSPKVSVDGENYDTIQDKIITKGAHTLAITAADQSGNNIDIQSIDIKIKTPTGQQVPLAFTKTGDRWTASYNFDQGGFTYNFNGNIYYTSDAYTTGSVIGHLTPKEAITTGYTDYTTWIIAGVVVGIVIIIFVVILLRGKRKR